MLKLWLVLLIAIMSLAGCSKVKKIRGVPEAERVKKFCPKGVHTVLEFVQANPYETEGKCYEAVGKKFQILDAHTGLYEINNQIVHVGFAESAPVNFYRGVVIGVGMYTYENAIGNKQTVPSFERLEKQ